MTDRRTVLRDLLAFLTIPASLVALGLLTTRTLSTVQPIENLAEYRQAIATAKVTATESAQAKPTTKVEKKYDPIEQEAMDADRAAIPGDDVADSDATPNQASNRRTLELTEKYAISIAAAPSEFQVRAMTGTPSSEETAEKYTRLLVREISLYPPTFVKLGAVQQVVLCNELAVSARDAGGVAEIGYNTIYLSDRSVLRDRKHACKSFHHELYHMIDWHMGLLRDDPRWSSLNPSGFRYDTTTDPSVRLTAKFPGFLNCYCMKSVAEDKAEVFANLVVNAAYVQSRMDEDFIFRTKVELMKERIARLCPEMNDTFWTKVAKR